MAKEKKVQTCRRCSTAFSSDRTQCPSCLLWNIGVSVTGDNDGTILLSDAETDVVRRISTGPWDACFGFHVDDDGKMHTGMVTTSVTLLGGAPGAGKSTLSLQMADSIAGATRREVLYISAEESNAEIRSRAKRLELTHQKLVRLIPIGVSVELGGIMLHRKPAALIVDSLPKVAPDTDEAVRFCEKLKGYAIELECPVVVIDHVTKEEEFAGLMALQHAVDTTLLFTVWPNEVRELKTVKNRNGPSGESVLLDMGRRGLEASGFDPDDEEDEDE